jgi:hypothetical protein
MDEEIMGTIRAHVATLAEMDYPKVWVGEAGMTVDELLAMQEMNDELPEELRVEPGEFVELEDTGHGIQMPGTSVDWIEGDRALALIPDLFEESQLGELQEEVEVIRAAKRGAVRVRTACNVAYAVGEELEALSETDRVFVVATSLEPDAPPAAMYVTGFAYRVIPLEELTNADVDDDLLENLAFHATDSMGPYVIEESARARAAVEERLREDE